jgi:hypothetical protein
VDAMRVAMAVLCIGAVAFLLRVLIALVLEWARWPSRGEKSRARGPLLAFKAEVLGKAEHTRGTAQQIGLRA